MIAPGKRITCLLVAVTALGGRCALADSLSASNHLQWSALLVGQADTGTPAPVDRRTCERLLVQARQAIAQRKYDEAETLIRKAEQYKPRYAGLLQLGDTPKKVRRVLEKARTKQPAPKLPSQRAQPGISATEDPDVIVDPFIRRTGGAQPDITRDDPLGASPLADPFQRAPRLKNIPAQTFQESTRPGSSLVPATPLASPLTPPPTTAAPTTPPDTALSLADRKQQTLALLHQAREALEQGQLDRADRLAQQAITLGVPDSQFHEGEDRPWLVALMVRNARAQQPATRAQQPATRAQQPATRAQQPAARAQQPAARAQQPAARAQQPAARAQQPAALPASGVLDATERKPQNIAVPGQPVAASHNELAPETSPGTDAAGKSAAIAQDPSQSSPPPIVQISDGPGGSLQQPPQELSGAKLPAGSLLDRAEATQSVLARQLSAEVAKRLSEARKTRELDTQRSLEILNQTRQLVAASQLGSEPKEQLLRRVEKSIAELEKFTQDNRPEIELREQNRDTRASIERERQVKLEVQQKIASLVEQFNELRDQQRFEEMEVVAKRARELDPDDPLVRQLWQNARFIRRVMNNQDLAERKERGVFQTLNNVEETSIPFDDTVPYHHPPATDWKDLSERRTKSGTDGSSHRSEKELEIERRLSTPVMLDFEEVPLAQVMDQLSKVAGINIHLDPRGMNEEGVSTDTPISITLSDEISLRSVLNLILTPLNLSYVIGNEVLKITSDQLRSAEVYTRSYTVADLVIPIPNFSPASQMGLHKAIRDGYNAIGYQPNNAGWETPMAVMASNTGAAASAVINPNMLAQVPGAFASQGSTPQGAAGAGLRGGAAAADFNSLMELITQTIQPDSWDEVGGPGSMRPFPTNLSLVISQTQDVHEEIADLLNQLRTLQDLQVTIEVRFITLNDRFFERIGIDFDFNIEDGSSLELDAAGVQPDRSSPSATVGASLAGSGDLPAFTADLDIPFRQDGFSLASPLFGTPRDVATFGFAILSDIEAFFLINAAQGDERTNVLQAPKVTLFNGQIATVSDSAESPFVISVVPVVGDFAAAQQPVIVVLSEGTFMTVQAVVSSDRRYVRLTVVPVFSQIGDVEEFTFEGSSTTSSSSSSGVDNDDDSVVNSSDDTTQTRTGTTVQLPTFAFVQVTTTVSVPDGGTVLLGGIKRLAEGRNEFGVPLVSKIPYINRLFKNVGIGRETQTLMMMVTPRIIIQQEEEENLLGGSTP